MCHSEIPAALLDWAKGSARPLDEDAGYLPLGELIDNAKIVALSEGEHFAAEPLDCRNELFKYLVEERGFSVIAIESGLVESRFVHDYVRGGPGDIAKIMKEGIGWTFDGLPQNRELIEWMRQHNKEAGSSRPLNFYGFDIPGSPSNPDAQRGPQIALLEALSFLDRVDVNAAGDFHVRVDPILPRLRFDIYGTHSSPGYESLSRVERDQLTATIADLSSLIERKECAYSEASTFEDYQWARRAAYGARQTDAFLRESPLDWRASDEQARFLDVAFDLRNRAQLDNLEWIISREGPDAKILLYAHNGHTSASTVQWHWQPIDADGRDRPAPALMYSHEPLGKYLRRRFGDDFVAIGNLIGGGEVGSRRFRRPLRPPARCSLDQIARHVAQPRAVLQLRIAPPEILEELSSSHTISRGFELPGQFRVSMQYTPRRAFDAVICMGTVSPAALHS